MKITLSKSQWQNIGKQAGWIKIAQENWYTEKIALGLNTPPSILRKILEQGKVDVVSIYTARNPNCPPDALKMVLERGKNNAVSYNAAENPNCPPEALKMVLERGKDNWVSWFATLNSNCPPLAKIQWMRMTGKIGKEDPTKHIIEKEEVKPDKDLQILRNMVSFNLSNYKTTKEKVAMNPNTSPDILRKILEKLKDVKDLGSPLRDPMNNWVFWHAANNPNCPPDALQIVLERNDNHTISQVAAANPNCPPDALKMVLERGKNDDVSCYAAANPNCPPDVLKMVVERGNGDWISRNVALNPNCPPETLQMALRKILEKGEDDYISEWASLNPNCPLLAKIQWMRMTGRIGKEDPTKHIIEYDEKEQRPDKDLQILRDLVAPVAPLIPNSPQ